MDATHAFQASSGGRWERRAGRERRAREEAENLLEAKSRELFDANQALLALAAGLEKRVQERTLELEKAREQAVVLAERDQLTDLPNRMSFNRVFSRAADNAKTEGTRVGLLLVDIDDFKEINDTLGHAAGDAFLRGVAERLNALQRRGMFVARLGGDEFAVVVEGFASTQDLESTAHSVIAAVGLPSTYEEKILQASCSIGVAIYPDHGTNISDTQRYADLALYRSKSQGRACHTIFDAALKATLEERHQLGDELKAAVGTNQLVPFFQPIVLGTTGQMVGVEVLARWVHPSRGLLTPDAFVKLAEEHGLTADLFAHQLRKACEVTKSWIEQGIVRYLSINVSPNQFRSGTLVETVLRTLRELKFDPRSLTVEITEELLLLDLDRACRQLEELSAAGIRISLDDFGTGYSNIVYLRRLPINTLKLDRLLIADVCWDDKARSVLKAVVEIARALELDLVAEGVETQGQARCLVQLGYEYLQGYLFGKPQSEREIVVQHHQASNRLLHVV